MHQNKAGDDPLKVPRQIYTGCWTITDNSTEMDTKAATQQAKAALQHADIVGHVQHREGGLGLGQSRPQSNSCEAAEIGSPGNLASGRGSKMCKGCHLSKTRAVDEMGEHREKKDSAGRTCREWKQAGLASCLKQPMKFFPHPKTYSSGLNEDPSFPLCSTPATLRQIPHWL